MYKDNEIIAELLDGIRDESLGIYLASKNNDHELLGLCYGHLLLLKDAGLIRGKKKYLSSIVFSHNLQIDYFKLRLTMKGFDFLEKMKKKNKL